MKIFSTILATVFIFVFAMTVYSSAESAKKVGQSKTLKPKHAELACFDCHAEVNPTTSLKVNCSNCHGTPEDVAKLTERKYKENYNPHNPLHYGTNALCENCHREHTPSKLECNNPLCHTEFKYETP